VRDVANFRGLLVFGYLMSWLPTFMNSARYTLTDACLIAAMLATAGTHAAALRQPTEQFDPQCVQGAADMAAAVFIAFIGNSTTYYRRAAS
jgi:hypothetical protein